MLRRDPAEDEGGRDARPRAGIGLAHHRSGRIARRIETRDDRPVLAQRAGIFVGQYAAEGADIAGKDLDRSEEHTSELQSLMRISYAVFCLKKKKETHTKHKDINKQTNKGKE